MLINNWWFWVKRMPLAATWQYGISHFIFIGAALWLIYRVVRGWLRLITNQRIQKD